MAFDLLLEVYRVTKKYPKDELYGLVSDMRRSANSITHNIAEGFGRFEPKDKTRFYKIAKGSTYELMSQTLVSKGLKYINERTKENFTASCRQIISELNAIIKTLES